MSDIVIRTRGLGRGFKSGTALDDLSIEVPAGIGFGFFGPNGAGRWSQGMKQNLAVARDRAS